MKQHMALTAIVVRDYGEAIAFYTNDPRRCRGFVAVE